MFLILILLSGALQQDGLAQSPTQYARPRIGVYDSQAIAAAYSKSPDHKIEVQSLKSRLKQAKHLKHANEVNRLTAQLKAAEARMDAQAMGRAPVENILHRIAPAMAVIQRENNLKSFIAKADVDQLKRFPGAEHVDVTEKLVHALNPSSKAGKAKEKHEAKPSSPGTERAYQSPRGANE